MTKRLKTVKHINLHNYVIFNAKSIKLNSQNEFECTNYGITTVTKPYRAKLNDQIAKIVIFSWMNSVYFRMIKTLNWKLEKWIRKAD